MDSIWFSGRKLFSQTDRVALVNHPWVAKTKPSLQGRYGDLIKSTMVVEKAHIHLKWASLHCNKGPWQNIIKQQDLITKKIHYQVGDGAHTFFWTDPWVNKASLSICSPHIHRKSNWKKLQLRRYGMPISVFWILD